MHIDNFLFYETEQEAPVRPVFKNLCDKSRALLVDYLTSLLSCDNIFSLPECKREQGEIYSYVINHGKDLTLKLYFTMTRTTAVVLVVGSSIDGNLAKELKLAETRRQIFLERVKLNGAF